MSFHWARAILPGIAAVAAAGIASPAAAQTCEAAKLTVAIVHGMPEPTLDNTLSQPELQALAPPARHGGRTQGLYRARIELGYTAQTRITDLRREPASPVCVSLASVEVRVMLRERRIYVAREWKPGTCAYTAILDHERKHQAVDEELVRRYEPRIRQAIESAVAKAGPLAVLAAQREEAQDRLAKAMEAAVAQVFNELSEEQKDRQADVDAGLEYARVTDSCSAFRGDSGG